MIFIVQTIHIHLYSHKELRIDNYLTITDKEIIIRILNNLNAKYSVYDKCIFVQTNSAKLYDLMYALTYEEYTLLID